MAKSKIILTGKHGRPSTLLTYGSMKSGVLAQRRQVFRGKGSSRVLKTQYYRTFRNNNSEVMVKEQDVNFNDSIVVRWGTRETVETNSKSVVYNKAKNLEYATNKLKSRELFIEKGVQCPKLINLGNFEDKDLPVIARPLIHSKGRNFIVLKTRSEFTAHFKSGWYYSNFIDKEREFRIHTAHGKVLAVMEKVAPKDGNIAWNRAQNDTDPFTYIPWTEVDNQELMPVLVEALKSVDALGLDFGGVDVMLHKGKAYVLELNTAPTLNTSPYVSERWGKYFDWLFKKDTRRDHWDYKEFKKGSSLIWKNYQLAGEEKAAK